MGLDGRGKKTPGGAGTHTGHTRAHTDPDPDRHTVSYFAGTPERTSVVVSYFTVPSRAHSSAGSPSGLRRSRSNTSTKYPRKDDLVLGTCPPKCCWADQVPVVLGTAGRTRYQVLLGGLPVPECSQVMPMPMPCPCTCDCTEEPKTKWAEYNIELCLHSSRLEQA